ncbi:protein translocase subunit SecD [Albidovulum sp.]|uniref:protein translocase subunit SecD n=1 Tax=Albidovulum sp. TaxID=1872424 RepID=UPI001D94E025|nr:protein translocase subunit SecD [Paracoccaceae bacterium]MCC0047307.1 protein translocase subunit SecD [Defluviimonas sp.]HPE26084.1 protein translocase subunit SecD [Albidovulum sp.]MCO5126909.1 protein translocase subunit SecD [Paracoccaceae bacterium]MCP5324326.1 protein translocase subunit SecD [Paracoccaceae bacterium]
MLQIPLWKRIVILGLCALGLIGAAPNLFYDRVERHNDAVAAVERTGVETAEQTAAIADWPSWLPSAIVNLGLDLRGGAHLLAEVQVEDVYKQRMDAMWPEVRRALVSEAKVAVRRIKGADSELRVEIDKPEAMEKAVEVVRGFASPVVTLTGVGQNDLDIRTEGNQIIVTLSEAEQVATDDRTMQQSLEIVRRRVDAAGTREPTIQRQGQDRILIEVPGIGSAAELKELIGTTAQLTFNQVIRRTSNPEEPAGIGNVNYPSAEEEGAYYILDELPVVTGEELVDARPDFDQNGRPAVAFRFNTSGARKFGDYTAEHVGELFAIVLDGKVISAPQIRTHIGGGSGIITGTFTPEETNNLAVLLRAGALPAKMEFLEERTVGPELGQDSIDAGRVAAIVGTVAVVVLMIASYGLFGVFASVALGLNLSMLFAILSAMGATLTLPGIAGIVLTVGMAVDANVLVFERIKEELKTARGPARAIELGYEKAMSAIIDANLTTVIAALILFFLGSGPVKGFAVTLMIGLITSVFTAIFVTRLFVVTWFARKRPKTLIV